MDKRITGFNKNIFLFAVVGITAALSVFLCVKSYGRLFLNKYSSCTNEEDVMNEESVNTKTHFTYFHSPSPSPASEQVSAAHEENAVSETTSCTPTPLPPKLCEECLPENFKGFRHEVIKDGQVCPDYRREEKIIFSDPGEYSSIPGITTFRGNNWRNFASYGLADITEEKLEKVWFTTTGYIDTWTGTGWSGQPSIVRWNKSLREKMNIYPQKKNKTGLTEVIYATLDGNIYFLDLEDGLPTRKPIIIGYPHKGSVSIDPRGYPLLYAGQGIGSRKGKSVPFGFRIYSLVDSSLLHFINGRDPEAYRAWGAFDSGSLFHSESDTLLQCGENGILYSVNLNTSFDESKNIISIKPDIVKYRYKSPYGESIGVENSPIGYKNYIYFADNTGLLQCIDINTLKPVWLRNVTDDTDSTMVLEEDDSGGAYIYTACEVDRQGKGGESYIRKIDALTGGLVWEVSMNCYYDPKTNGGALASPVVGKNTIGNLVIFNIAKAGNRNSGGKLIALDKKSGNTVWSVELKNYSWSSPVAVYSKQGKAYLILCDSGGHMHLFEAETGRCLDSADLEAIVEASPAVFENIAVVGTRGQKIWGVEIR